MPYRDYAKQVEKACQWQRDHRERANANKARWLALNPEKRKAANKKWYDANPEINKAKSIRWNRGNKVKNCAKSKRWRQRHPDRKAVLDKTRAARRRRAPGRGIKYQDWLDIVARSVGLCTYCGRRRRLSLDHIEPLVRGGAHDPENAVAACKSCNSSKHDKSLLLWMVTRV